MHSRAREFCKKARSGGGGAGRACCIYVDLLRATTEYHQYTAVQSRSLSSQERQRAALPSVHTMVAMCMRLVALAYALTLCSSVPSVPPPPTANALQLQHTIDVACAAGVPATVTVEPGVYVFSNRSLVIAGASHLVLQAAAGSGSNPAVRLVFYYGFGVQIVNSDNVTVRGPLALDSNPPNYAQGVVRSLRAGGNASCFDADFDPRFLSPDVTRQPFVSAGGLAGAKVSFWDPKTRLVLPGAHLGFMATSQQNGPDGSTSWRISLKSAPPAGVAAGNLVTVIPRRGITHDVKNSSRVLVEDVSIYAGGNMGFHESLGAGGHIYRRVKIVRKPGSDGLVALNADGFHSSDVGKGPVLEDSEIAFTGDDFVNVHNRMLVVCKPLDTTNSSLAIIDVSNGGLADLVPGDEIRFYQLQPGVPHIANPLIGVGHVKSSARLTDPEGPLAECYHAPQAMGQPPYNTKLVVSFNAQTAPVYRVEFAQPLPPVGEPPFDSSQSNLCMRLEISF